MKKASTYGTIENGKLKIHHRALFLENLQQLTPGRVEIIVKRVYRQRSLSQNAYYWGVLIPEFCTGYFEMQGEKIEPDEAHDFLKQKFNNVKIVNKKTGEIETVPKSTTMLTTSDWMDYESECRRFISEWFGRTVPEPGDQSEIQF